MRFPAWVLAVLLATGCVLSTSDYTVDPEILLRVTPMGLHNCAQSIDKATQIPYRTITAIVYLRGMPPAPIAVTVNGRIVHFPAQQSVTVEFRAGVGRHVIGVEAGGHRTRWWAFIHKCK